MAVAEFTLSAYPKSMNFKSIYPRGGAVLLVFSLLAMAGCSSEPTKDDEKTLAQNDLQSQVAELRTSLTSLSSKLELLETKVSSVNDKIDQVKSVSPPATEA